MPNQRVAEALDTLAISSDEEAALFVCAVVRLWADRGRGLTEAVMAIINTDDGFHGWQGQEAIAQFDDLTAKRP